MTPHVNQNIGTDKTSQGITPFCFFDYSNFFDFHQKETFITWQVHSTEDIPKLLSPNYFYYRKTFIIR